MGSSKLGLLFGKNTKKVNEVHYIYLLLNGYADILAKSEARSFESLDRLHEPCHALSSPLLPDALGV